MTAAAITVTRVDYAHPVHAQALVALLDAYAQDPMGGGTALSVQCKAVLCQRLHDMPGAASWIAWADSGTTGPADAVGLLNSFLGFSTFRAQPLLNIHDIAVLPGWRGRGIAQQLLAAAESHAHSQGCCKLTLEVLEGNQPACSAYQRFGFEAYTLDPAAGAARFMHKLL